MARLSHKGWSSDPNFDRFTGDQLERFKDGIRDDMAGRHDGAAKPTRKHESPVYLKMFGDAELVKHNYTLDLERAKRGDKEAAARVRAAEEEGLVPIGISIAQQLAAERLKQLEEEKRRKAEEAAYSREWRVEQRQKLKKRQQEIRSLEGRIKFAEHEFYGGKDAAAVDAAKLYLVHPGLDEIMFKTAQVWFNRAKECGIVDVGLLRLFAETCASSPTPGIARQTEMYSELIREALKAARTRL